MTNQSSSLHIGIVGCSAEGASLCYRTICLEGSKKFGKYNHPEISIHTHSLSDYMSCIEKNDWEGVGHVMLSSAKKLDSAGCDFLICPDNTIHQALSFIEDKSPLPWLHIADVVSSQAKLSGFKRVGLTGTRWLVESNVYPEKLALHGLEFERPEEEEREAINEIIMNELVFGNFKPESIEYFQKVIQEFKSKGCDAVVLGCTEIPLIINDSNSPLPTLDSARLLACEALKKAYTGL